MHKIDLIRKVADDLGATQTTVEAAVDGFCLEVVRAVSSGEAVNLPGIGSLRAVMKPEHQGTNPRTGEKITITARNVPKFRPCKALRAAVKGE